MTGIYNGLQNIIDTILAPIRLINSIISMVNKVTEILITIVTTIIDFIATLPSWLTGMAMLGLFITVIYQLIGRETGK